MAFDGAGLERVEKHKSPSRNLGCPLSDARLKVNNFQCVN